MNDYVEAALVSHTDQDISGIRSAMVEAMSGRNDTVRFDDPYNRLSATIK